MTEAAAEIKALVSRAVNSVSTGNNLIEQAGSALNKTSDAVRGVSALMLDIARMSREQSEGIDHINEAIAHIDDVAQQNAALVEQGTSAAEIMEQRANALVRLLSMFQVDNSSTIMTNDKTTIQSARLRIT